MAPLTATVTGTWMILNWSPADDVPDLMARFDLDQCTRGMGD
jgi:hypothetical protein